MGRGYVRDYLDQQHITPMKKPRFSILRPILFLEENLEQIITFALCLKQSSRFNAFFR